MLPISDVMPANREKKFSFDELEEILIYFSSTIMQKNNEHDMLWDLVRNCIAKLDLVDCVIYFVDPRKKVLVQKAAYGPKSPQQKTILKPITIPLGKGITGTVAVTGIPEIVDDTTRDIRYIVDDESRLSEVAVPIMMDGKVFGVIDCEHPLPNFFTRQHLRILMAIASLLAVRVSWIRAEKKVKQKEQRLLRMRQEAADLKIRALKAQMNPHFVFNALNAIQHFITTNEKKSALTYLSLFSKLLRFYLQYLDEDTIRVADEIKILTWYLTLQELRYEGKFKFSIKPADMNVEVRIPALVTQLFVEERVEHIMLGQHNKASLAVNVSAQEDHIRFSLTFAGVSLKKRRTVEKSYRNDIPRVGDHLKLINQIKKYGIETFVTASSGTSGAKNETHELVLPIIE